MPNILLSPASTTAALATPGKLILNGKTFPLTHVYARRSPNSFDPNKLTTYILATDRELSPAERLDSDTLNQITWNGNLNAVEIELNERGGINWQVLSRHVNMSLSGSRSPNPFALLVTATHIQGAVKLGTPDKLGETAFYFEFPVDVPIETQAAPAAPTAASQDTAQKAPSAKAYLAYMVVLMKGDKDGLRQVVDPAKAAMLDAPEFPEMLQLIQSTHPTDVQVLRAAETGDKAELTVTGNGGQETGTVRMANINGQWVVMKESWKNR